MVDHLAENKNQVKSIDVSKLTNLFSIDVIGSCAFGIQCNSFKNPNTDFLKYGNSVFHPDFLQLIRSGIAFMLPNVAQFFDIKLTTDKLRTFYTKIVEEEVARRRHTNYTRKDLLQTLIHLQNSSNPDTVITMNELIAQVFVIFVAGFETIATTITFCLLELAYNEDIQRKTRDEIQAVLKGDKDALSYNCLAEMKYTNQVVEGKYLFF